MNPNAIPLLEKNSDKINWSYLSSNPNAIHLLEQNTDKINWVYLSKNPNAIPLLEKIKIKLIGQVYQETLTYLTNKYGGMERYALSFS